MPESIDHEKVRATLSKLIDFLRDSHQGFTEIGKHIKDESARLFLRKPHVISVEVQLDTHKSRIGFADLLKAALRHRPDRIIVGEIRGPEARVFLDALNTVHRGSLTTIHANSAEDALRRLAQLAMRGSGGVQFARC